jgi:4-hydroxybenzoate polyprenyltransferase
MSNRIPLSGRVEIQQTLTLSAVFAAVGLGLAYLEFERSAAFAFVLTLLVFLAIPGQWGYDIERGTEPEDGPAEPLIQAAWQQFFRFGVGLLIGGVVLTYFVHWGFLLLLPIGFYQMQGATTDMRWYLKKVGAYQS